ncbi:uncharacterized protein LOC127422212 isoform X1 [Myxocyprinus asiaticus]|uniref:uncharacterized protein LOC127422212 isoform X1 n=1 Tax=Myxocyprinus asiaticus TaxID=70543 RepID=UPI0022228C92|nr:uncharacterized protein LOC127422212 isoform X1 [Myxocyprinus asiaticus]
MESKEKKMPRTKHSHRSEAARKRKLKHMAAIPEEALPPLKKLAELSEHHVLHNGAKLDSKRDPKHDTEQCLTNLEKSIKSFEKPLISLTNKTFFKVLPESFSFTTNKDDTDKVTMNAVSDLCPQTSYIRGSFHQGHSRFGPNKSKQHAVNSLTAIMMCKVKSVLRWTPSDLNAVLMHGDDLYSAMRDAGKINDPARGYIHAC